MAMYENIIEPRCSETDALGLISNRYCLFGLQQTAAVF
jgi:hypothetical protein